MRGEGSPIGAPVTMNVSGVFAPVENRFAVVANIPAGSTGQQPIVDLNVAMPPSGIERNIAFLCNGSFEGLLVVEGSLDGSEFSPIGDGFRGSEQPVPLLGPAPALEFTPLTTKELVRYVRIALTGIAKSDVVVTLGGSVPSTSGSTGIPILFFVSNGDDITQALGQNVISTLSRHSIVAGDSQSIDPTGNDSIVVLATDVALGSNNTQSICLGSLLSIGDDSSTNFLAGRNSHIGISSGNSVVIGQQVVISDGSDNCVAIGGDSTIGGTSPLAVLLGYQARIAPNSPNAISIRGIIGTAASDAIAIRGSLGDNTAGCIVIGRSVVGSIGGTHAPDNIVIANNGSMPDGIGASILIGGNGGPSAVNSSDAILLGHNSSIGSNNQFAMALGDFITIHNNCNGTLAVGAGIEISSTFCSAIGREIVIGSGSSSSFAVGLHATVGDTLPQSVAINASINNTNVATSSIAINGYVGTIVPGIIVGKNTLANVALGGTIDDESRLSVAILGSVGARCDGCLSIYGTITDDTNGGIVIGFSTVTGGSDSIAIGTGNNTDDSSSFAIGNFNTAVGPGNLCFGSFNVMDVGVESSSAFGVGAHATRSREVIFSAKVGVGNEPGVELFHAKVDITGGLDLLKFDVTNIANNHDSAMFLLYKNAAGNIVMNPVTVNGATGALTVPV